MLSGSIRHRLEGVFALAFSVSLLYLVFEMRVITPKVLYLIPATAAVGLWLVVFGHPKRDDGLAPRWWRLGLVTTTALFFGIAAHWLWP
jgi:hypothetical protein